MRANWIEMTATQAAANTNPTSLAAVANLPTWSDVFGSTGSRMVEYEMDDGAGRFECGYGNVNLATGVLSRDYPVATFDPAATPKYNVSNPVRLTTFGAAVAVRCSPLALSVGGGEAMHANGVGVGNGYLLNQVDVQQQTSMQGWRNFFAFLWTGARPITSVSINVKSAGTAGKLRVGLMEISAPGVYNLVKEFTENSQFDLTLSGVQTINNFSKISLPPGPYVLQFVPYNTAGGPAIAAATNQFSDRCSIFGRAANGTIIHNLLDSVGATTLAQSLSGNGNGGPANYNNPPLFFFGMS